MPSLLNQLDLTGYRLTFDDEFSNFSSNGPSNPFMSGHTGTWDTTYSYGERKLNDEVQQYSDSTVGTNPFSAAGGVLGITAAPSTDLSATWGQSYTSGVITSFHSFAQRYGYFEMRAELPEGPGFWPAFWLLPLQHVWPPELDPLEAFGSDGADGSGGAFSFHSGLVETGGGEGAWQPTGGANLYTRYNTFGVDWEPDLITFYFNGRAYASTPTPADFDQPMYLIANLAVGGNWAGAPIGETGTLKIDYIRAFSRDGANPPVVRQAVSSPDGGGYNLYNATDANGVTAVDPAPSSLPDTAVEQQAAAAPTGDQTFGTGPHAMTLMMSEDRYQGDAQFVVTLDGVPLGGVLSTSASHAAGAVQRFTFRLDTTPGHHSVGVNFINNYGGAAGADRNLFLTGATFDGQAVPGAVLNEYAGGIQGFSFVAPGTPVPPAPVTLGSGPDRIILHVSEDTWLGDAQFTIRVDGLQVGPAQTAAARRADGQTGTFVLLGAFAGGVHDVEVSFLNDIYGGGDAKDRNLYIDSIGVPGGASAGQASLFSNGSHSFKVDCTVPAQPNGGRSSSTIVNRSLEAVGGPVTTPLALFDPAYYLTHNPDVAAAGVDPLVHFEQGGWREGRDPNALFGINYYLAQNPDVMAAGVDPLMHFEQSGWHEGRSPDPLFDTGYYLARNPDVAAAGVDPLLHFEQGGWREGRNSDALFDVNYYLAHNPDVAAAGVNPLVHFEQGGWHEGRNPDAFFDVSYYLAHNPDVAAAGVNPLVHFEQSGWREGRNPSAAFDTNAYLNGNPDVRAAGVDPLAHYLTSGQAEGRATYSVT